MNKADFHKCGARCNQKRTDGLATKLNFLKKIKNIVGIDRTIAVLKLIIGGLISVQEVSCSGIAALFDYLYMSLK